MKKGVSLLEAMLSLFLGSFILIAGNNFLINVRNLGERAKLVSERTAEKSLSLFQMTSIIRKAGEGIKPEFAIELKNNEMIVRRAVSSFEVIQNCSKGDRLIKTSCSYCKVGKKVFLSGDLYEIKEKGGDYIVLDRGVKDFVKKGEKVNLVKEFIFTSDSKGTYLKIDRGSFQLITDKYFELKFSNFSNSVVKISGKEKVNNEKSEFDYYVFLPYVAINGGGR